MLENIDSRISGSSKMLVCPTNTNNTEYWKIQNLCSPENSDSIISGAMQSSYKVMSESIDDFIPEFLLEPGNNAECLYT
jgi:hypothetical protein